MIKVISVLLLLTAPLIEQGPFDVVKFEMSKRTNRDGKTMSWDADVYFSPNGTMLSHFVSPTEVYITNNEDGELQIYNPETNEVFQSTNYQGGTQGTTFYYFLRYQASDMGLKRIGFKMTDVKNEDNLIISTWEPPVEIEGLAKIELVRELRRPIFMGYQDFKGGYIKKVYFYNYENIGYGIDFPMSITEIDYVEKDSIVSKTEFVNFIFDNEADKQKLNFEIPADAKVLE